MSQLKHILDRKSLETMYLSFVRPVMEYGNVVWGGSYDCDIQKLEKINIDERRLLTGAPANSNIAMLYEETSFNSVKERIQISTLNMFYKIINSLAPAYLSALIPNRNINVPYNLRNSENVCVPMTRLETFKRSFYPRAIDLWNKLDLNIQQKQSLSSFKSALKNPPKELNILFYYGQRWPSIHHARLRMGCSLLSYDLCLNLHVVNDPSCRCGAVETPYHFFFNCTNYSLQRERMLTQINHLSECTLNLLFYGDAELTLDLNRKIFEAVHTFIRESNRFK